MRSDFSDQNGKSTQRKSFTRARLIRALIFIAIGFGIGFWLSNKPKSEQPPKASVQPQAELAPKQVIEAVELPVYDIS